MSVRAKTQSLANYTRAEFLRILGSQSYWLYHAGVLFIVLLFGVDLFFVARPTTIQPGAGIAGYPFLFYAIWERLLPLGLVICTSVFWAAADSQHGMIRVVAAQPLTRGEYVVGKHAAIGAHAVVLILSVAASELVVCVLLGGVRQVTAAAVVAVATSTLYAAAVALGFSILAVAVALMRRTIGSGLVGMLVAFVLLGVMSYSASGTILQDYVPLRYYFLPCRSLVELLPGGPHSYSRALALAASASIWRFAATSVAMSVICVAGAAAYCASRDITE